MLRFCALALLALLVTACGKGHADASNDGSAGASDGGAPSASVEPPQGRDYGGSASSAPASATEQCPNADYSLCDIRDAACETRIAGLAACLRGSQPLDVHVDVLTEDEYTQQTLDAIANQPPSQLYHFYRVLALLKISAGRVGTLSAGVGAQVKQLAGVYEPDKKRIVIVDHGMPADSAFVDGVLLHESIHALQDADYDLSAWFKAHGNDTFDRTLALKSIVEGEARFYEMRASVPFHGDNPRTYNYSRYFGDARQAILSDVLQSPSPYDDSFLTFPYAMGASLIDAAWLAGGPPAVDPLWASPPLTTQRVMAEVLQPSSAQKTTIGIDDPQPSGLSLDSQDALGAWGLTLFFSLQGADDGSAEAHGLAWRADHFWVYTDDAHREYGLWQLELASEAEAQAFDAAAAQLGGDVEHASSGTRAFVSLGVEGSSTEVTTAAQSWLAEP